MAHLELIIGCQNGDEGKGKIVDLKAQEADLVIRANGGCNAGHTVINEFGKFGLHLIPAGIFSPKALCLLGPGVLFDLELFDGEARDLRNKGLTLDNLLVSDRATVVLPYHRFLDKFEEKAKGSGRVGTTGKGIGPACAERDSRTALCTDLLKTPDRFMQSLSGTLKQKRNLLNLSDLTDEEKGLFNPDRYEDLVRRFAADYKDMVVDSGEVIEGFLAKDDAYILGEGAQGAILDKYHGTYPYVTSSPCTAAGFLYAAGLPPTGYSLFEITGIYKAYVTKVGAGPMPTKMKEGDRSIAQQIREKGNEFGTTTGRPRDVAWFDAVAGRQVARLNGLTGVAILKGDVLANIDPVKVCVAYNLDGKIIHRMPANAEDYAKVEPVYQEFKGWPDIKGMQSYWDLPEKAVTYYDALRQMLDVPITLIGVGAERNDIIYPPAVTSSINPYCIRTLTLRF